MNLAIRVVVGVLLVAHGLVHLLWFAPNTDSSWPFTLDARWIPEAARRPVAVVLVGLTIVTFALLALAIWGVPVLGPLWPGLAVAAATSSLLMLVVFWNAQLIVGVVIDVALLVVAVVRPDWMHVIG